MLLRQGGGSGGERIIPKAGMEARSSGIGGCCVSPSKLWTTRGGREERNKESTTRVGEVRWDGAVLRCQTNQSNQSNQSTVFAASGPVLLIVELRVVIWSWLLSAAYADVARWSYMYRILPAHSAYTTTRDAERVLRRPQSDSLLPRRTHIHIIFPP